MAGEYGEGIAYKGLTMHKAKRWHTVTGKGLCAVMCKKEVDAKQDGPVVLGWRHPWEGHDDHGHGHGHLRVKNQFSLLVPGYACHSYFYLAPGILDKRIPLKNEDEWPGMKVFVDELLVMSSGIALFFVHFSKLLAEKDSQEHRTFLSVSNFKCACAHL